MKTGIVKIQQLKLSCKIKGLNFMYKFLYVITISTILFSLSSFCLAQTGKQSKIYSVVDTETEENAAGEIQSITVYKHRGDSVTTIELYFSDKDEQEKRLREIMFESGSCGEKPLVNNDGSIVGSTYLCHNSVDGKKVVKVGYSYFDSLNKITIISAQSMKVIEDFAKGICPLASELYNEPGCPDVHNLKTQQE